MKQRVLFICNHNAGRSQMAEGLMRAHRATRYEAYSAGLRPSSGISPFTVAAMEDAGIDISSERPKAVTEFMGMSFSCIVRLCDCSDECTPLPSTRHLIDVFFTDPATVRGSHEEVFEGFCRIRDEIGEWIEHHFGPEDGE